MTKRLSGNQKYSVPSMNGASAMLRFEAQPIVSFRRDDVVGYELLYRGAQLCV
jgi:EAL domain-containing protein (putative c-di-GMP-specific phosphodiesterase class I)